MKSKETSVVERAGRWVRQSLMVKLFSIGIIMLLLMIPNAMVEDLIHERRWLQQEVTAEVSEKWGNPQTLTGPVLVVPFIERFKKDDKWTEVTRFAYFLPENLSINGELVPEVRKRSLYKVNLYKADLTFAGRFGDLGLDYLELTEQQMQWDKAKVIVGIGDLTGIEERLTLKWDDKNLPMQPGIPQTMQTGGQRSAALPNYRRDYAVEAAYDPMPGQVLSSGVSTPVDLSGSDQSIDFMLKLNVRGSQAIHFLPIGKETVAEVRSDWANPSFEGSFLPSSHDISESGFSATWKVLDFNRNYPQQWVGTSHQLGSHTFGLKLFATVDEYTKNTRSAKYAFLLISLSFLVFFFFEIINGLNIHSIQYVFIGLAISIFYVLLLSLSEHIGFNGAYWISTAATVGLVTAYGSAILKDTRRTGVLAAVLAGLYTFIFIILQLEDYALLAGSIGLFAVLAIAMLLSRKIDWYNLRRRTNEE